MDEISSIKNFFESHQIRLSDVWLESCVSWCKEENLPANYTIKDLQLKVYEQWLLLDLRDTEVPCLPPDLSSKKQYVLNGNYSLQMMQVIDISKPKYWQIQRIRNNVSKNADQEVESSKRALLLTLTDGVQEVVAMEYEPIPCLNLNLTPGIKIRLMGPITIRRGRLMLQNQNVKVLGGEVDDLIVENAAENILAKFLKLTLNPKPQVIEENLLNANTDIFDETGATMNATTSHCQNSVINKEKIQPSVINRTNQQSVVNRPNVSISKPTMQIQNNAAGINEEEEMRIAAEIEQLMEVEREFEEPPAKIIKTTNRTPDMFEDMDFDDYNFDNDIPDTVIRTNKDANKTSTVKENNVPISTSSINIDLSASLEQDNDVFENLDMDVHMDGIDKQVNRSAAKEHLTSPKSVILTIEKLLRNIPNISSGKFRIRAKFKSVIEKLTIEDDEYHLMVKVEDDSGDVTVKVHNDVLTDWAGYSPVALMSLRSSIEGEYRESRRKIIEILKKMRQKLLDLNNLVEVQVNVREKFPMIVNIL